MVKGKFSNRAVGQTEKRTWISPQNIEGSEPSSNGGGGGAEMPLVKLRNRGH